MATAYTGTTQVDDSVITLMDAAFLLAGGKGDNIVIDQFTDYERDINAKSIDLTKYAKMSKATTPLSEAVDPDGVQLSDTKVTFTPVEQGNVITTTKLASLQTGGKIDLAGPRLVGNNAIESLNALGIQAGEGGTNELIANSAASEAALVAGDVIQETDLNYTYNRLNRANVEKFDGELYVAIVHPDVAEDIKLMTGFEGIQKYADAMVLLRNEIGIFKGFRIVQSTGVTINTDAGASAVDSYHTQCFGRNALGRALSADLRMVISGPFDKLGRFMHIGWYSVIKYKIVDQDSHWLITSSSSYGSN